MELRLRHLAQWEAYESRDLYYISFCSPQRPFRFSRRRILPP